MEYEFIDPQIPRNRQLSSIDNKIINMSSKLQIAAFFMIQRIQGQILTLTCSMKLIFYSTNLRSGV